jgi:hypothetical protein
VNKMIRQTTDLCEIFQRTIKGKYIPGSCYFVHGEERAIDSYVAPEVVACGIDIAVEDKHMINRLGAPVRASLYIL